MSRPAQRILAGIIGAIFLYAGYRKLLDPAAFAIDIRNYRILPWTGSVLAALYLPWVEIVCGFGLLLRFAYRGALWIAAMLLATFILAYASTRLRGLDIDCGCFGHGVRGSHWPILIMDPLFLAAVIWLLITDSRPPSLVFRATGSSESQG